MGNKVRFFFEAKDQISNLINFCSLQRAAGRLRSFDQDSRSIAETDLRSKHRFWVKCDFAHLLWNFVSEIKCCALVIVRSHGKLKIVVKVYKLVQIKEVLKTKIWSALRNGWLGNLYKNWKETAPPATISWFLNANWIVQWEIFPILVLWVLFIIFTLR